jgi:hypothetical protein
MGEVKCDVIDALCLLKSLKGPVVIILSKEILVLNHVISKLFPQKYNDFTEQTNYSQEKYSMPEYFFIFGDNGP